MDEMPELPPDAFRKLDTEEDELFYREPRFVYHIDAGAVAALTQLYREVLSAGGVLLDLMSSWVSHLPPEIAYREVIGHGLNAAELAANKSLNRHFLQNLNRNTTLPLGDDSIDGAMIAVSIQYLEKPVAVLRDVARVLLPGAPLVISFSNRCFWTKAVAIWRALSDEAHAVLVARYLEEAGFQAIETHRLVEGIEDVADPMTAVVGRAPSV